MQFFMRKRRVVAAGDPPSTCDIENFRTDTVGNLCALAKLSREKLRPWATMPLPDGLVPGMRAHEIPTAPLKHMTPLTKHGQAFRDVGDIDGVCIYLMFAKLDVAGRGHVEPGELQRFLKEVEEAKENVTGFATMFVVMATLALAITVPLLFWPLITVDAVAKTAASPSLGGGWPYDDVFFRNWLLSPAMPVVHWFELIFLGASIFTALKGILLSIQVYAILAVYAPDNESRAYALYDNVETITSICYCSMGSLVLLPVALIFLAARTSPPACIVATIVFLMVMRTFRLGSMTTKRVIIAPVLNQLRIAREILAECREAGGSAV